MWSKIVGDGLDLRDDEVSRNGFPGGHAPCVLGGDGSDGGGTVHTGGGEGLQIRLDAGPAARVATRDCQCCTHTVRIRPMNTQGAGFHDMPSRGTLLDVAAISSGLRVAAVLFVTVLTVVAAQVSIPLPFTPVPFTLQPMVVLLGGAALGARLGMSAQVLYLALGIAGLPVFAASPILPQGFARLLGPTGGYLLSYPIAAFVSG